MKKLLFLALLLCSSWTKAQTYDQSWNEYFSFYNIKDIVADPAKDQIIVAAENALFITNSHLSEVEKITTLNGLSGDDISTIAYSDEYHSVLIGYENGLIQVYNTETKKVKTIVDIVQKATISPEEKRINHFDVYGDKAYIATNYGVSVFNIRRLEFGDTYYIGNGGSKIIVNDVIIFEDYIFAATEEEGIKYAEVEDKNLVDYQTWNDHIATAGNYNFLTSFNNQLYVIYNEQEKSELHQVNVNGLNKIKDFQYNVVDVKASQDYLSFTFQTFVVLLKADNFQDEIIFDQGNLTIEGISVEKPEDLTFQTAVNMGGHLFIGDANYGLLLIEEDFTNNKTATPISQNGPLMNDVFAMDLALAPNEMWIVYGRHDFYYTPNPSFKRGVSHLKEEFWSNYFYKDITKSINSNDFRAINHVKINPKNPNQIFLASYYDGFLSIEIDEANDEIQNSIHKPASEFKTEKTYPPRLGPFGIDSNGKLWFGSALSEYGLYKYEIEGNKLTPFKTTSVINKAEENNGFGSMQIDLSGNIYMGTYKDGVIAYNPNTKKFGRIKGGENEGNLFEGNYVRALALDHNQQLWIGADRGLRVLYNPSRMFEDPNLSASNIVFKDDSGVAQELFAGLAIVDIQVDGNNNKWVGSTAGVYQVSADGQKTLHHFTTENSPLPSNDVNSIKIDPNTGEVFIATQKGLVGFRGSAKGARDDLKQVRAYPNPVRPGYQGRVIIDGLMNKANVKITDIEGNLVYEEFSQGGSIEWDTRAFGRHKVASGVYLVLITSEDQTETKVAKIMIIR